MTTTTIVSLGILVLGLAIILHALLRRPAAPPETEESISEQY